MATGQDPTDLHHAGQRTVFVSAAGQADNIGDTVLRRAQLDALRPSGRLHIFVNDLPPSYLTGLGLRDSDVLHRSGVAWRLGVVRSLPRRKVDFWLSPGEVPMAGKALIALAADGLLAIAVRAFGGTSGMAGVGLREPKTKVPTAARWAISRFQKVSWRDVESRDAVGIGSVQPDWAFAEGSAVTELADSRTDRKVLAVSLRGDQPSPTAEWVDAVASAADRLKLTVVVVAQVERDNALANSLAERFGGGSVLFSHPDHAEHEEAVRHLYRRSALVISDRLHALIIGATEGASPAAVVVGTPSKVRRTMSAAGYDALGTWDPQDPDVLFSSLQSRIEERGDDLSRLDHARSTIADLTHASVVRRLADEHTS